MRRVIHRKISFALKQESVVQEVLFGEAFQFLYFRKKLRKFCIVDHFRSPLKIVCLFAGGKTRNDCRTFKIADADLLNQASAIFLDEDGENVLPDGSSNGCRCN